MSANPSFPSPAAAPVPQPTRSSGVLLHITSLSTPYGIGDMGPEAVRFGEFLALAGQSRWQMLPIAPTASSLGNSPYSSFSAFAGNPLLISPTILAQEGLVDAATLARCELPTSGRVDFEAVEQAKGALLRTAFNALMPGQSGGVEDDPSFAAFRGDNAGWLPDYALFMALKDTFGGAAWSCWPKDIRDRSGVALREYGTRLHREIVFHQFCQWLFFRQWGNLRWEMGQLGIELVGDVPIYVTHDSADVWANQHLFKLDADGQPTLVAGVPPDYFSATGQRWGNPVYDWAAHQAQGYAWWISRMRHIFGLFDLVRLDHFRGFAAYWEIPAAEKTAIKGQWVPALGREMLTALRTAHGSLPLIAEDLGVITPDVVELKEHFGLPGMKILQFAFGAHTPTTPDAPHNHEKNCVVYTGTHDNNTTRGWFMAEAAPEVPRLLARYLGHRVTRDTVTAELMHLALMSPANCAMFPAQDLLDLGAKDRMNTPGTTKGNWGWRLEPERLLSGGPDRALAEGLRSQCELFGRTPADAETLSDDLPVTCAERLSKELA